MSAPTDDTSITVAQRTTGDYTQDPQTRSWVLTLGAQEPTPVQVIRHTQLELAKLRRLPVGWDGGRGAPFHPALANVALNLVATLTTPNVLATPQFSPSPGGGLDIVWLVSGNRLTASLELEEISLFGTCADGQDAFPPFEHRWFELPSQQFQATMQDARTFLEKISINVEHQLPMS